MSQSTHGALPGSNDSLLLSIRHLATSGTARTRKELSEQLGVAKSTISENVSRLIKMGVLEETEQKTPSGVGRRPLVLVPAKHGPSTLVVDVGVASIDTAVITSDGRIEKRFHLSHNRDLSPGQVLAQAVSPYSKELATFANLGVSFAGPVDQDLKLLKAASSLPSWAGFDVDKWSRKNLSLPAFAINDANAMAWAEHFQISREHRDLQSTTTLALKLASGMGMGLVVSGRLHLGADGSAGEISHISLDPAADQLCLCGRRGCIETVVSGSAILARAKEMGHKVTSIGDVVRQVRQGNVELLEMLLDRAGTIGLSLAMLTNFLNPHRIVLSGPLFTLETFSKRVQATILEACHPSVTTSLQVYPSNLGPDGVLLGVGLIGAELNLKGEANAQL